MTKKSTEKYPDLALLEATILKHLTPDLSEFMTFVLPRPLPVLLTPIWLTKQVEAELILFLHTAAYSWAGRWHFLLRFGHRSY